MLTAESLIQHHTFDLNAYKIPGFDPALPFNTTKSVNAYQLQMTNGHKILYFFPLGTSVLSVPGVALMNLFGISAATPDGRYNFHGAIVIQKFLAAFLMAVLAAVFFRTASLLLSPLWSLIVAAGSTFGTEVWSTASRGMWEHTWEILLGAVVAYFLLRNAEDEDSPLRPILLATLLSWMFFVRPTGAVPIFFISGYILLFRLRRFAPYALTGAFWLVVFMWIWMRTYGTPFAAYYACAGPQYSVGAGYRPLLQPDKPFAWRARLLSRDCLRSVSHGALLASDSPSRAGRNVAADDRRAHLCLRDTSYMVGRAMLRGAILHRRGSVVPSARGACLRGNS